MSRRAWQSSDAAWKGGKRPYDLLKEVTISFTVVAILAIALSLLFASPDPVRFESKDVLIEPETIDHAAATGVRQHFERPPERME